MTRSLPRTSSSLRPARSFPAALAVCVGLSLGLSLWPRDARAVEFTIRGTVFRLDITDSLYLDTHSFSEPIVPLAPNIGQATGNPLNPFSGIDRLFKGDNTLPLTRSGAAQAYGDLYNRFNISLSFWRINAGLRIDTSAFLNPPQPVDLTNLDAGGCGQACESRFLNKWVSPTGLEKVYINYTDRKLDVTLGDFYAVFGRGLVLSVHKVDELGIDTTLLGAKAVYNPGPFKLIGLLGVSNIQNVDEATGRFQKDPFDLIAGARVETRLWDKLIVGVHAAGGALSGQDTSYSTGRVGYGATLEAPHLLRWLDLYFEGAGLENFLANDSHSGYALYGSATAYAGPFSALLEGKLYHHFDLWQGTTQQAEFGNIAYNQPPTVERVLTELDDPQTEIGGARLLINYRASSFLTFIASDAFFVQRAYGAVAHDLSIQDPYLGVEVRWQEGVSHIFVNGGYRYEHDDEFDQTYKRTGWFDWDLIQALPHRFSLESQGRALFRTKERPPTLAPGQQEEWDEGNAYVALKWTPYLVGALGLEWSTRDQTVVEQNGQRYLEYGLFPNGLIQYNFTTRSSIKLWAGGQRGGLKCISGVCRTYPDVRGARLELVLRF